MARKKFFKVNLEKPTQFWFGISILILSVIYIFATLGRTEWANWIAIIFGYFLVIFLFIEGGIYQYFKRGEYRKLSGGDFMVWVTLFVAGVVFLNTSFLFNVLRDSAPMWLINFVSTVGVTSGVIAGILAVIYIFTSPFK